MRNPYNPFSVTRYTLSPDEADFINLSQKIGIDCVAWRYDPIFIDDKYTLKYHIESFEKMAKYLSGSTKMCIISFIDLYQKVWKNFPEVRMVNKNERIELAERFVEIGQAYGITIKSCAEGDELAFCSIDCSGCMTKEVCKYCYANFDSATVRQNMRMHNPESPLLVGDIQPEDKIHQAHQESWIDNQMILQLF